MDQTEIGRVSGSLVSRGFGFDFGPAHRVIGPFSGQQFIADARNVREPEVQCRSCGSDKKLRLGMSTESGQFLESRMKFGRLELVREDRC